MTASASFQLISKRSVHEPTIKKTEEIRDAIACEIKVFTASTSEVRFVRSFAGVISSIVAYS